MKTEYGDEFILALTMWREASGEKPPGMEAVGHVICNRALKNNTSITRQCLARNQFTSISVKGDPGTVRWYNENDVTWIQAQSLARGLMSGTMKDITNGAQFYWNPKTATSNWFREDIVGNPAAHPRVAVIGAHEFFA